MTTEGTDPLRERLPRPNAVRLLGHCKSPAERSIYGYIEALETIAREALAAAPEPEWEYRVRLEATERRTKAIPAAAWEALLDD